MSTSVDSRTWSVKPTCTGTLNSTRAGTKREYFASFGPGWQSASVLRRGHRLGESNEVASGVLDAEFAHAVKGGADGHDNFHVFHGGKHSVQVINLHVQRSEEHTSELQSPCNLVCRLLLEKKKQ